MNCFDLLEIGKVRGNLFQINGTEKKPMVLPDAVGAAVNLSEKVYVPVKEFPDVRQSCHSKHLSVDSFNWFVFFSF